MREENTERLGATRLGGEGEAEGVGPDVTHPFKPRRRSLHLLLRRVDTRRLHETCTVYFLSAARQTLWICLLHI